MNSHEIIAQYENLLGQVLEDPWYLKKINFDDYQLNATQIQNLCIAGMNIDPAVFYGIPKNKLDREICLAAVKLFAEAIKDVPPEFRNLEMYSIALPKDTFLVKLLTSEDFKNPDYFELIKAIAKKDPLLLNFVANTCPAELYYQLCLETVNVNGLALQSISEEHQDYLLDLTAVRQIPAALAHVKPKNLTPGQYIQIIQTAVQKDIFALNGVSPDNLPSPEVYRGLALRIVEQEGAALSAVNVKFRDRELCLIAVKKNGLALESVPPENFDNATYRAICVEAIRTDPWAIEFIPPEKLDRPLILEAVKSVGYVLSLVPKPYRDDEVCLTAVQSFGGALEFVPPELVTFDLLLTAVKKDGTALKHITAWKLDWLTWLTDEQYKILCLEAVQQCSKALEFVDDLVLKKSIINKIGFEKIIANDYDARHFIPEAEDYEYRLKNFLLQVKHVVVTQEESLIIDTELRDIFLIYSHADDRNGVTIHVDKAGLDLLLKNIQMLSSEKLNLVLLGHSNADSQTLADISVSEAVVILRENKNINRLTLLGCNTAKSLMLDQEAAMIQRFIAEEQRKMQLNHEHGFALVLMSKQPETDDYVTILHKVEKDKKGGAIDRAFIIVQEKHGDQVQYQLIYIERKGNDIINDFAPFDQDKITSLQNDFNKGKPFVFPNVGEKTYLRGGRGAEKMSLDEILCIYSILQGCSIFDRKHPGYKEIKKLFPFLSHLKINQAEQGKLLDSLLKLMVEAIQQDPEIRRMITVKGFTKGLHGDTKEQRMHVTRTHLYLSSYLFSMFGSQGVNIDERKLSEERKKTIEAMKQRKVGEQTISKSISFIVNPNLEEDINNNNNNNNNNNLTAK